VRQALSSGAALSRLRAMIARQGGDSSIVDDPRRLPQARHRTVVTAERSGYVVQLAAERLGQAAADLGAGRERVDDPVDHAVGVVVEARLGTAVRRGDPVLRLHYNDADRLARAIDVARSAIEVGDAPPETLETAIGWVE